MRYWETKRLHCSSPPRLISNLFWLVSHPDSDHSKKEAQLTSLFSTSNWKLGTLKSAYVMGCLKPLTAPKQTWLNNYPTPSGDSFLWQFWDVNSEQTSQFTQMFNDFFFLFLFLNAALNLLYNTFGIQKRKTLTRTTPAVSTEKNHTLLFNKLCIYQ